MTLPALIVIACSVGAGPDAVVTPDASVALDASVEDAESEAQAQPATSRQEPLELVSADSWRRQKPSEDPLQHLTDEHVPCSEAAMQVEGSAFEIDMSACNFALVSQPLLGAVARGERLELTVWWHELINDSPTRAHLALLIDDELLWEEELVVPGAPDVRVVQFDAPRTFSESAPVQFHLHNHGYNTYKFGSLKRIAQESK